MPKQIAEAVLPEFDHEMASTRKILERVPEKGASWKPHDKSFSLGDLATHVGNIPSWVGFSLTETELDVDPPGGPKWEQPTFSTTANLLQQFDANVKAARDVIQATTDGDFMVDWSLKGAGKTYFTMPRVVVLRSFVMNHLIHHRGQLSVYLRLNDVPLPQIYGPTADEPAM